MSANVAIESFKTEMQPEMKRMIAVGIDKFREAKIGRAPPPKSPLTKATPTTQSSAAAKVAPPTPAPTSPPPKASALPALLPLPQQCSSDNV